jgi:hypothetical protein
LPRSFSKDVEHAVNNVVEAMVRKLFEIQDRLMQKEADFLKLHQSLVNDLEKNIVKQFENQRFSVEGEKGTFEIKGLQQGKIVFANEEKTLHVPLEKVDLVVKAIDYEKTKIAPENQTAAANIQTIDKLKSDLLEKHHRNYSEALIIQENHGLVSNKFQCDNQKFLEHLKAVEPKEHERFLDLKEKNKEINNELNKLNILDYGDKKSLKTIEISKTEEHTNKVLSVPAEEGKNLEKAKEINNDLAIKLNKNVENNLADLKSPFLINSQIRGQMEVLNLLKSLSDKEIISALKEAGKQAKIENKSIAEVYSNNLQRSVNSHIQASKERTLDTAINTFETNKELRNELRKIDSEINKNIGILYQAGLEQKISPEEYNQLKERLEQQKSQIDERYFKINQNENQINNQLKTDLKYHFQDLKTDKLSLNDSLTLAKAAYSMTDEKTIENLRNFSLENKLKETIQTIDKATKEVEYEIKEITEIAFSR